MTNQTLGADTPAVAARVREALDDDRPVPLEGLTNVWSLSAGADEAFVLLNLVLTVAG